MANKTKWSRIYSDTNPKVNAWHFRALLLLADITGSELSRRLELSTSTVYRPLRVGGSATLLARYCSSVNIEVWKVRQLAQELELTDYRLRDLANKP